MVDDEVQIGVCLRRVGLPDMTGAQLVESFRRLDPDQAKRIVFITGGDTDAIRRQFPQYPVIAEPFEVHGVRSVVEAGSGQRAA